MDTSSPFPKRLAQAAIAYHETPPPFGGPTDIRVTARTSASYWDYDPERVCHKIARILSGADPHDPEHWTDLAGYAHAAMRGQSQTTTTDTP